MIKKTVELFNNELKRDCSISLKHFMKMLADSETMNVHFYWTFDRQFLIFACSFFECDELLSWLCNKIIHGSQRSYFGILNEMKHSDKLYFQMFADMLIEAMKKNVKERMN